MDRVISFVVKGIIVVWVLTGVGAAIWYAVTAAVAYWAPAQLALYLNEFPVWKMVAIVFSVRGLIYVIWDR